jgi:hypothetical protein
MPSPLYFCRKLDRHRKWFLALMTRTARRGLYLE